MRVPVTLVASRSNPHSVNPSSMRSSDAIDDARARVLRFFNASPVDYHVVFTKSATGALKLVGEGFPWQEGSQARAECWSRVVALICHGRSCEVGRSRVRFWSPCMSVSCDASPRCLQFRYLHQNHNSVLGIREFTTRHGGTFQAMDEVTHVDGRLGDARNSNSTTDSACPPGPTYVLTDHACSRSARWRRGCRGPGRMANRGRRRSSLSRLRRTSLGPSSLSRGSIA